MKSRKIAFLSLVLVFAFGGAQARLSIEISGGEQGALPIAVVPFGFQGGGAAPVDLAAIVRANLKRSGRFAPLEPGQLPAQPHEAKEIDFPAWRGSGTDHLVVGRISLRDGGFQVEFQLFDLLSGAQLAGYSIPVAPHEMRRAAHQISDFIYEKLTGEPGAFDTHIAYVTVQNEDGRRVYRLAVADADGHNEQVILTSKLPLMSPAWSPEGQRLAYVSFESGRSTVFIQEVATGKREEIAAFAGINSAPAWAPDGQRLALTLSRDGNSEIYVMNLADRRLIRITNSYAIDTEPAWTSDGRAIIFTSDRGGRPQLYRMELGGSGPRGLATRLTFEGSYNARPAISPDGKQLAMVHQGNHGYQIAVMELATGNLRVLTSSRLDESPSFSPNGAMLIYASEASGRGVLGAVSVFGSVQQRLGLSQGDVREPSWSPYIKRKGKR